MILIKIETLSNVNVIFNPMFLYIIFSNKNILFHRNQTLDHLFNLNERFCLFKGGFEGFLSI
jgi:hypothetical protein